MTMVLMNAAGLIEQEIAAGSTRKEIAKTYALALRSHEHGENPDWKRINAAILSKWKMSGLQWIKERAWSGKCFDEPKS